MVDENSKLDSSIIIMHKSNTSTTCGTELTNVQLSLDVVKSWQAVEQDSLLHPKGEGRSGIRLKKQEELSHSWHAVHFQTVITA